MADVSHSSVGYVGTVDQVAEAKRFQGATAPFRVMSSADWQVTVDTSANLTVDIAAGSGQAFGVRDTTSSSASVAVAANTGSGTRYDAIVATFNWAASTPATSFGVVQGTTAGPPAVTTSGSPVAGTINRIPGVQYDAVLAIVEVRVGVGLLSTTDLFDSRVIGGLAGTPITTPTTKYRNVVDAAFPFISTTTTPYAIWSTAVGDDSYRTVGRISIPDPGFAYYVRAYGTVELTGAASGRVDSYMNIASTSFSVFAGTPGGYNLHLHSALSPVAFTGARTLELRAYRQSSGIGTWTSTGTNFSMACELVAV